MHRVMALQNAMWPVGAAATFDPVEDRKLTFPPPKARYSRIYDSTTWLTVMPSSPSAVKTS